MPRCANIKVDPTKLKLDQTRKGKFIFSVSNALQRTFNARAKVIVEDETKAEWMKVSTPRFELIADKTHQIDVDVECPSGAKPGSYVFHLQVVNHANPDEECDDSEKVTIEVPEPPPKVEPKVPGWLWAVIAGAVVLTGGIVFAVLKLTAPPELGEVCDDSPPCARGECVEEVDPEDANAKRTRKVCRMVFGQVCTNASECSTKVCAKGKCAWPEPGEICKTNKDCPPTQSCTEFKLASVESSIWGCMLNENEPCDRRSQCAALWCNPKTKRCAAVDGSCKGPSDCDPKLQCINSKCVAVVVIPPTPPPKPCPWRCPPAHICSAGECVPLIGLGSLIESQAINPLYRQPPAERRVPQ